MEIDKNKFIRKQPTEIEPLDYEDMAAGLTPNQRNQTLDFNDDAALDLEVYNDRDLTPWEDDKSRSLAAGPTPKEAYYMLAPPEFKDSLEPPIAGMEEDEYEDDVYIPGQPRQVKTQDMLSPEEQEAFDVEDEDAKQEAEDAWEAAHPRFPNTSHEHDFDTWALHNMNIKSPFPKEDLDRDPDEDLMPPDDSDVDLFDSYNIIKNWRKDLKEYKKSL